MSEDFQISYEVIGAAIEVHRHLGPGLLESAYQQCLAREMTLRDIPFKRKEPLRFQYKGICYYSRSSRCPRLRWLGRHL